MGEMDTSGRKLSSLAKTGGVAQASKAKALVKPLANVVATVLAFPLYALFCARAALGSKDGALWSSSQLLSLAPGISGVYLRRAFYRFAMKSCGPDCAILFGTIFSHADTEVGKRVYIGPNCNIGLCRIGDDCMLGSNVHIMSGKGQHVFESLDVPVREQGGTLQKTRIGEDTWIGNGALIMADVGKKCIIGAGSVVVKPVSDFSVVAGNPARLIRKRGCASPDGRKETCRDAEGESRG